MILEYGNIWSAWDASDLFLITANSYIRRDGALAMGRGIAKEARDRLPGIDLTLGEAIRRRCGHKGVYGLLVSPQWPKAKLGLFQVKRHFASRADTIIIEKATSLLHEWSLSHPHTRVDLNFPGIGWGHLSVSDVLPIIERLPDTVHIWRKQP